MMEMGGSARGECPSLHRRRGGVGDNVTVVHVIGDGLLGIDAVRRRGDAKGFKSRGI